MTSIDGIQIEKNAQGEDAFIRKYKEQLQPFLQEIGLADDDFEKEWEVGLTVEEAKQKSTSKIKSWWKE